MPVFQSLNFLCFQMLFILAFVSHLKTMLTDPGNIVLVSLNHVVTSGSVPKGNLTEDYLQRLERERTAGSAVYKCHKCASVKPERAHHCSICDRCIRRYWYFSIMSAFLL